MFGKHRDATIRRLSARWRSAAAILSAVSQTRSSFVQSTIGKLHINRLIHTDKLERMVSQDEAELLRYLELDPRAIGNRELHSQAVTGKQPEIRAYGHLSEGPFSESGAFSVDILSGFVTAQIGTETHCIRHGTPACRSAESSCTHCTLCIRRRFLFDRKIDLRPPAQKSIPFLSPTLSPRACASLASQFTNAME